MAIIEINNFSQNFGDKLLFEDTSFVLNPNEKIGLTGVNGAGKSTLLKIIMGQVLLDKGTFYKNPRYRVEYLDQHAEVKGEDTIKEYLCGAYKQLFDAEKKLNNINETTIFLNRIKLYLDNLSKEIYQSISLINFDLVIEKIINS